MKKIILIALSLFLILPAYAGQYEDALRTGRAVFLYLHTKNCNYCKAFNPIFEKTFKTYKDSFQFVSIDAESPYGMLLMNDFHAGYVPFVILADARRQYMTSVLPDCLIDNACLEGEIKNFLK